MVIVSFYPNQPEHFCYCKALQGLKALDFLLVEATFLAGFPKNPGVSPTGPEIEREVISGWALGGRR